MTLGADRGLVGARGHADPGLEHAVQVALVAETAGRRDIGRRLAPAQQEQLFQPFARLGQEARGVDGVGLGLVITKRLLEMMHGRIEVKSDPSAGSVFTLTLPSAGTAAHGAVEAHPRPVHLNHDTRGTVLYVEDNEINALVFENVLSFRPGVRLLMAVNQAEALARCADVPLDVAFIDLSLGLESGYDVLQAGESLPFNLGDGLNLKSPNRHYPCWFIRTLR